MTLTDYAKHLLNVCGKRFTHLYQRHYLDSTPALPSLSALLTYLRTQTATIYAYLQSRLQGDPTSGIPSVPLTTPLTLANLLPNLQKLATRKIDAGASTQIPEGISLVRLLCDTTAASAVTELIDTNTGWTLSVNPNTIFPNAAKLVLGCETWYKVNITTGDISFPNLKTIICNTDYEQGMLFYSGEVLSFPNLETMNGYQGGNGNLCASSTLREIYLPKLTYVKEATGYHTYFLATYKYGSCPNLEKIVLGKLAQFNWRFGMNYNDTSSPMTKLIHFEIGQDTAISLDLRYWTPTLGDNRTTFLSNFRQYLFLRLADRTATTALTLTLSSAVYTALTTETSTLAELGITTLTDKEQAAGITLATAYNTWLDTYRAAINWNITNAG